VNIGAGLTYIPGFVNVDLSDRADISLNLSTDRLPLPDDSVRIVISDHTLEHVPDYLFALSEIYRVLQHDGVLLLKLPYVTLTELHLVNPYHFHNFSERSFDLFDPGVLKGSAAEQSETAFRKVFVRYWYIGYFGFLPRIWRTWARRHLFNVVRQFDIGLVAIKDPSRPVDVGPKRARELEARLVSLASQRTGYDRREQPSLGTRPVPARRLPAITRLRRRLRRRGWGIHRH
jgi:SAM-dependent methyltransferase